METITVSINNPNELLVSSQYGWCHIIDMAIPKYTSIYLVPDDVLLVHRSIYVQTSSGNIVDLVLSLMNSLIGTHSQVVIPDLSKIDISVVPTSFKTPNINLSLNVNDNIQISWIVVYSMFLLIMGFKYIPLDVQFMNIWYLLFSPTKLYTIQQIYQIILNYCNCNGTELWYVNSTVSNISLPVNVLTNVTTTYTISLNVTQNESLTRYFFNSIMNNIPIYVGSHILSINSADITKNILSITFTLPTAINTDAIYLTFSVSRFSI